MRTRSHAAAPALVTLAALFAFAVGGCAGGSKDSVAQSVIGDTSNLPNTPTELAAYAGNARFPTTQPTDTVMVAAIVSRDKKQIKLYNFDKEALRNVEVWVNGSFVKPIGGIAPSSAVTIKTDQIFNGLGHTLASRNEEIGKVQIQTKGVLYNLLGHVAE